jgi:hypothetical protein|nr:MAG TPA: hypothetical protein [Caudoviricetes sp.]
MVDDKKIEAAVEEYNEKVENELEKKHIPKRTFAERYAESAISECAFKAGAKWAICELLNDLWHPASEKPILRNGKCLVVYNSGKIDIFKISFVYEMLSNYGKDGMGWKCWAYVLDLFPKEGGNHD